MSRPRSFNEVLATVKYKDLIFFTKSVNGRTYLQLRCPDGVCVTTGEEYAWRSRKWYLSPFMTRSEIVQTAFKAVMTAVEHEVRENFKYKDELIFGPHFDVDRLHELCLMKDHLDVRD